jgi:1,4-dihydroxy-2-naphthoate octaprenyltransferase
MEVKEIIYIIKLGRLHLVISTLLFYILGSLLAVVGGYSFIFGRFILGIGIVTTAILSMSYSNNYYDAEADQYNKPTPFSGGSTGLSKNKQTYALIKPISLFFMCLSVILTILFILMFSFSFEFLLYVITGNLFAWYYTAPPIKFSYRGFGEIVTVITTGLMLPGFGYFVLAKTLDLLFMVFIIPLMLYVLIFILNAEIPDVESDRKGKKYNLIIRKNPHYGLKVASVCGIIVILYSIIFSFINILSVAIDFRIITLLSLLPLTFVIISIIPWFVRRFGTLRLVMNNITSIILVVILLNSYLFYIVISK